MFWFGWRLGGPPAKDKPFDLRPDSFRSDFTEHDREQEDRIGLRTTTHKVGQTAFGEHT